jgi:hypothetical protein
VGVGTDAASLEHPDSFLVVFQSKNVAKWDVAPVGQLMEHQNRTWLLRGCPMTTRGQTELNLRRTTQGKRVERCYIHDELYQETGRWSWPGVTQLHHQSRRQCAQTRSPRLPQ